jgi:hypothetical protein
LKYEFPEVALTARILYAGGLITVANGQIGQEASYREDKIAYADPAFLQMFTYPLLTGKIQVPYKNPTQWLYQSVCQQIFWQRTCSWQNHYFL